LGHQSNVVSEVFRVSCQLGTASGSMGRLGYDSGKYSCRVQTYTPNCFSNGPLWFALQIGESVIQLLQSFSTLSRIYFLLKFVGVALLLLFSLAMQYFDACQVEWYEHALTKSAFAGVAWIWLHVPMTLHLFRLEVWLKELSLACVEDVDIPTVAAHSFAVSLGIVSLIITAIRMCNSMPDSSVSFIETLMSSEMRSVLVYTFRIIVSVIQMSVGFTGVRDPMVLLVIECCLTILTTLIDIVNDITAAALKKKEARAKVDSHVVIKSLKHFPRQWSRLQLVRKESLLEMNLISDDGFATQHLGTSKLHASSDAEDPDHMDSHRSDPSSRHTVTFDFKKLIESEVLKSERGSTHYDGLVLRKSTSVGSLLRGPSLRIVPIGPTTTNAMPTLMERNSENRMGEDDNSGSMPARLRSPQGDKVGINGLLTYSSSMETVKTQPELYTPTVVNKQHAPTINLFEKKYVDEGGVRRPLAAMKSESSKNSELANSLASGNDWMTNSPNRPHYTETHYVARNYSVEIIDGSDAV
jgi:hypothetical protein